MRYPRPDELSMHPRDRVATLVREDGDTQTALACGDVLLGESDPPLLLWLGGRHAAVRIEGAWPRTWALRAFLYCWDDQVGASVVDALTDDAWRVREMAARVVVKRELPACHLLEPLVRDPLSRVRVAGLRALGAVGEAENADAVLAALGDGDAVVARAAAGALSRLERRLDRPFGP
ncbi:MAG: HEAT repeat domain-containing protein [Mycobacteriales bacterium]